MAQRKDKKGRVLRKGESYNQKKGMYVYNYTDPSGKRRFCYAKDLRELREREEGLKKDQLDGIDSYAAGKADLNFLFDRYITTKRDIRDTTKANYISTFDRYVRGDLGKKKLGDIKYSDVIYFYSRLMSDRGLQMGTIEYIQRIIRPTLEMAVRDEIIRQNPASGALQLLKQKTGKSKMVHVRNALTMEQQREFLEYIGGKPLYKVWEPLFVVLLGTGLRVGELIGLRWDDIDFENRMIYVRRSLYYFAGTRNKSNEKWKLHDPKTEAGVRDIPMVDLVYEAFQKEKARQDIEGIYCQTEIEGVSGFVFYNRFYQVHNPQSINRALDRIVEDHNSIEEVKAAKENREPVLLPNFSCHYLRHTFCTRLCEADVPIKVIQDLMGHKDIQTTMDIYAEVTKDKKKESLNAISKQMKLF